MTKYRPAPAYSQDESKLGRCAVETPGPSVDAFACNQTRLLLAVFGYQIVHAQRAVLERATGTGWSLRRLLERVLRAPARFTVSGRRIAMIASPASSHWQLLGACAAERSCPDFRRSRYHMQ